MAIVACQSQCIDKEGVGFTPNEMSAKKFLSHSASVPANSRATNFDSMADLAIILCLADFQLITPPPKVKT